MLIVVEDRDVHRLAQPLFDLEALRRFDVFQVDAAEARLHQPDCLDELFRVLRVQFQINRVQIGEPLEEERLPLHHRLAGQRADVAQAEHGGAVGDDGHQIAASGVEKRILRVLLDGAAGGGDTGGIGEGQIMLRETGLGRHDLQLAVRRFAVVFQGLDV